MLYQTSNFEFHELKQRFLKQHSKNVVSNRDPYSLLFSLLDVQSDRINSNPIVKCLILQTFSKLFFASSSNVCKLCSNEVKAFFILRITTPYLLKT